MTNTNTNINATTNNAHIHNAGYSSYSSNRTITQVIVRGARVAAKASGVAHSAR